MVACYHVGHLLTIIKHKKQVSIFHNRKTENFPPFSSIYIPDGFYVTQMFWAKIIFNEI